MPSPAWEDLDAFLQIEDFATTAVFTLLDSSTREVVGIYDDPYLNAQLGEYQTDTSEPRFTCKEADTAGIQRKCTAVIHGRTYDVMSYPQQDGTGMAIIRLTLVP
jgi:hypothetical protein